MARHQVTMITPARVLEGLDVKFDVVIDEVKKGTLLISRGGLDWKPRNSKGGAISCSWTEFIDWMGSDNVEE